MSTEPWVSVEDVSNDSIDRWIEYRGLPAHKVDRSFLDVQAFLGLGAAASWAAAQTRTRPQAKVTRMLGHGGERVPMNTTRRTDHEPSQHDVLVGPVSVVRSSSLRGAL